MDDYASLIAELETRTSRKDIAAAIGVEERELDEIASGYVPDEEIGERLRSLATTGNAAPARRIPARWIAIFVAVDLVFFAGVVLFVLTR